MKIIRPGEKLSKDKLRYFAKMAGRAYVNDPVHSYATKNPARRVKFVYHFMMERLNTSNGEDYFYIDDEERGVCVWRRAHNEYGVIDFLKCPDWLYLYWFWPNTLRTLFAYSPLDVKVFDEDTWIISPVFVDPEFQGRGIATELITRSMEDLSKLGYKFGLEAQDEGNVRYYKKLGFKTVKTVRYEKGNITHYYMVREGAKE
ncbi:MAG: GNAT family N-acetyltransferase [Clostridia bacterium]|nr:GNAT family N-acetyltransferase [Clostridia bacterium]